MSSMRPGPEAPNLLRQPHVARRPAAVPAVGAARHRVGGVALDGLDRAVGIDGLDDPDVAPAPDDQVAGLRRAAGRKRAAGALGPVGHRADGAAALALLAERHPGLLGRPGDEVRAPRADARAGGGLAVL